MSTAPNKFQTISSAIFIFIILLTISGFCALLYELVWFQLVEYVIGSSAISLGIILVTYMGGLCLGSILLPYCVTQKSNSLRLYAWLEFGIGIWAIIVFYLIPQTSYFYSNHLGYGLHSILLRGLICILCLLPPTILMGATLPAASRWLKTTDHDIASIGLFYTANIFGGVLGCLVTGLYLLKQFDMATVTFIGVGLNGLASIIAYTCSKQGGYSVASLNPKEQMASNNQWPIYIAIGLSGFSALGAEVVWTRLLSITFGPTVYAFTLILAVFLTGLGLGSYLGSKLVREIKDARWALGWCQFLQIFSTGWAAIAIANYLPYLHTPPINVSSIGHIIQLDIFRSCWIMFPATFFWGASFPFALAAARDETLPSDRLVSRIYAMNTFGAIMGVILFSLWIIPSFGTAIAERLLVILAAFSALIIFKPTKYTTIMIVLVSIIMVENINDIPGLIIAYGRHADESLPPNPETTKIKYIGEGMNSSIAVTEYLHPNFLQFHVSGRTEASSNPDDMRLQRMLAYLPTFLFPQAKSVLVIGFGAGVTAGSFVPVPGIQRIVICEIEPLIPKQVSPYFAKENFHVFNDPRTEIIYDDARSYIFTTSEKFDIITADPVDPWMKGAASIYTKEYFQSLKDHLNPGGIVTQWIALYDSTAESVKSELATFFSVFPDGSVWFNHPGYDVVLMGSNTDLKIDPISIKKQLSEARYQPIFDALSAVGFISPMSLLKTYGGNALDLKPWYQNAPINTDHHLHLLYLTGMALDETQADSIFNQMHQYYRQQ